MGLANAGRAVLINGVIHPIAKIQAEDSQREAFGSAEGLRYIDGDAAAER